MGKRVANSSCLAPEITYCSNSLIKETKLKETKEEEGINKIRYIIVWVTILAATSKRLREDFGHLKKMKSSSDISLHTAMDVGVRFLRKLVRTCLSLAISLSKLCFLFYLFISPGN
jgi:hypothetical protein